MMRAVVYSKPFEVTVENVPVPTILDPNDVIVKVTTSAICGSDLHMYEGRTAAAPGIVFGHEVSRSSVPFLKVMWAMVDESLTDEPGLSQNMGIVTEIGAGVQ